MMSKRRAMISSLAATAALGISAPAASATTTAGLPAFSGLGGPFAAPGAASLGSIVSAPGPCGRSLTQIGQGDTAGTVGDVCMGPGLSFIGPAVGQVATVIGPTVIGPAVVTNVVVAAGNGAAG